MTGNPAGEIVEGNVSDLDHDAKFFVLEDRTGKAFVKIYWKAAHDEKMRKQKVGYYEAPLVTMEENTGGMQEAVLVDLPFKDRGDFPRMQKKGYAGGGGRQYQPRNERIIVVECMLKAYCELWCSTNTPDQVTFADAREDILKAVEQDLSRVLKAGGV